MRREGRGEEGKEGGEERKTERGKEREGRGKGGEEEGRWEWWGDVVRGSREEGRGRMERVEG